MAATGALASRAALISRYAPAGEPLAASQAQALADFLAEGRARGGGAVVLTGAGLSTESGIPDYRSPEGSYSKGHKPMVHADFVKRPTQRARYWARSLKGFNVFARSRPNLAHRALAALEREGFVRDVITQNVDRLHQRAGSRRVLDLHGRGDWVECLSCKRGWPRATYQQEVADVNAAWIAANLPADIGEMDIRADGDAHLANDDFSSFVVPPCQYCGGVVMPSIVFFGGTVRQEVKEDANGRVQGADCMLVMGSSCQVFSSFRLVQMAARAPKPVAMVNIGETRADALVQLRLAARCSDALAATCRLLGVSVR